MPSLPRGCGCLFVNLACAVVCFPVLLFLAPQIERTRGEARRSHAYDEVVWRAKSLAGEEVPDWDVSEIDPWGTPYRITRLPGEGFRVTSAGENKVFLPEGVDDDIRSDMPVSPWETIHAEKNRQWLFAFTATGLLWVVLLALMMKWPRQPDRSNKSSESA